jgi:hypothetical protein
MTEEHPIVGRIAETAKTVINESAKAMSDESKKIDADDYEIADAIATVTRVVDAGLAGSTEIVRIAAESRWPERQLALGDYVSTVVRRMARQSGTVAQAAAYDSQRMQYTPKKWLESVTRFIDIAIAGGMEIAETVAAGPARFEHQPVASDPYTAPQSKETRPLAIGGPLKRDGTDDEIPPEKVSFEPVTLIPPNRTFRVLVNATGLTSGVYTGSVRVGSQDGADSVPVQIAL